MSKQEIESTYFTGGKWDPAKSQKRADDLKAKDNKKLNYSNQGQEVRELSFWNTMLSNR